MLSINSFLNCCYTSQGGVALENYLKCEENTQDSTALRQTNNKFYKLETFFEKI